MADTTPRLIDDMSNTSDLAVLSELSGEAIAYIVDDLRALPLAECNMYCRAVAMHLLDELSPHLSAWEAGFCGSIAAWKDSRRLSTKQIGSLHYACRSAARRAIAAQLRAHRYLIKAVPANTLPA
jgi:hypothetical protein